MSEAVVFINGHLLTEAQSITVRVALENFDAYLRTGGLGDDGLGESITKAYQERIAEVRKMIFNELANAA